MLSILLDAWLYRIDRLDLSINCHTSSYYNSQIPLQLLYIIHFCFTCYQFSVPLNNVLSLELSLERNSSLSYKFLELQSFITQDSGDRDFLVKNMKGFDVPILNYVEDKFHRKDPFQVSEEASMDH